MRKSTIYLFLMVLLTISISITAVNLIKKFENSNTQVTNIRALEENVSKKQQTIRKILNAQIGLGVLP
jgi:hypothetical protein